MRSSKFFIAFAVVMAIAFSAGCGGGGGNGFRIPDNPLVITSSTLPDALSGDYVDFDIPIAGGCNGPYVVEVIAGSLPRGVGTLDGHVTKLQGFVLEAGNFTFTVKITDTTCVPFYTATQDYTWEIGVGDVKIVDANPVIIPNASYDDPQKWPGADALETVVFSTFVAFDLIPAGGVPPYTCSVIDDPNDPNDGDLPLGVGMAPNSCSLVGTPVQVRAGGAPFLVTFRVTDAVGNTADRKLQWKIDTPPIIVSNSSLSDGKAGTSFSDAIQIVDGVAPFEFELTDNAPDDDNDPDTTDNQNDNITYIPGGTPTVDGYVKGGLNFQLTNTGPADSNARLLPTGGRMDYPAENEDGPNYNSVMGGAYRGMLSEGLYFRRSGPGAGSFFGTPRRRGTFSVFVHVYSTLVPNERGQHGFKELTHTIDPSEPPAGANPSFDMNPAFTLEGAFNGAAPHGTLPEAEVTVIYNPDANTGHTDPGLRLLADGGVPTDGFTDAPHEDQRAISLEGTGEYEWAYSDMGTPLPQMDLLAGVNGVFGTLDEDNLERSGLRSVSFTVSDHQLPLSVRASDTTLTREFQIAVGPDLVIITESNKSWTGTSFTGGTTYDTHDNEMKIRTFEVLGGSSSIGDLSASNLAATTDIPDASGLGATDLAALLSGQGGDPFIDIMRASVNPAGWWNDVGSMHPKGGRMHMGADNDTSRPYYGAGYQSQGGWNSSTSGVELPETPTVTHAPLSGVYANGGKMYFFQSSNRFGCFVIRKDSKIYVPFAWQKGTDGYNNFGDGVTTTDTRNSTMNAVPLAISPDGRWATVKIITNISTSMATTANRSTGALVLMSLTGEKFPNGETFRVIDFAASGTYMYSTSVVMTDQMIYFLTGNQVTSRYESYRDHFIHEFNYRDTSSGALLGDGYGTGNGTSVLADGIGTNWTQTSTTPMQTPFHRYNDPTDVTSVRVGTSFSFTTVTIAGQDLYAYDGWNMGENSTAPVPFRVSADGQHCAVLAGLNTTSTSGATPFVTYCWVASNGGDFNQASTAGRRCPNAGARGYSTRRGPTYYPWGGYGGPTPGLEIADDGSAVAFVYNNATSISVNSWGSSLAASREDVVCCVGNGAGANPFTSATEYEVTKNTFGGTGYNWRFGSLVFTKDNQGLIFFGGLNIRSPTQTGAGSGMNSSYNHSHLGYGTYYAFNLNTPTQVQGVIPSSLGGAGAFPVYTAGSPFAPAATPAYGTRWGAILPVGGFVSRNREYFYFQAYSGVNGSSAVGQTSSTLLGINIEDLSGGGTASGHTKGRGFRPGNWPARRSFIPHYYYGSYYLQANAYFTPLHTAGGGLQAMDAGTGNVFWLSHYQGSGPSQSTSTTSSFSAGPAVASYWADYGYRGAHLEGFNADVGGPVSRLSHNLGGDTSSRAGRFLTISSDGKHVAYQYNTGGSTNLVDRDQIGVVRNIEFDPTSGALTSTTDAFGQEVSNGRGGNSMHFDSSGGRLFYAFKTGTGGNARDQDIVQLHINAATNAKTTTRFTPKLRYNVLYSGR